MPKVAVVVSESDVAVAKRVLNALDVTARRFHHFRASWEQHTVPGTRTLPLRQMRALYDAACGRAAGPFARFYTCSVDDNWYRLEASNRISRVNVLRPGASHPSVTHSGDDTQTVVHGLGTPLTKEDHKFDPACPCLDCRETGRDATEADFTPEGCATLNKYGFYPAVINNWNEKRVIHDCLTHAPPEVRRAHGLPEDNTEATPRNPSDTRVRTSGPAPAASSAAGARA